MGTPHCGSGLAEWAVIGSKFLQCFRRINQGTLEILQQKSEVMARIRHDFHTMLRGWTQRQEKEIAIICFYEELPVRAVGEVVLRWYDSRYPNTDHFKIVPKGSATLDRYTSIGIHANHMDMTKFLSDQDPDYRNVLSELLRFIQPLEQQPKKAQPLALSTSPTSPETQGQSHSRIRNEGSSVAEQDQTTVHGKDHPHQLTRLVNTFSGNFNTGGGKMIQGGDFNSGGGPMTF